MRIVVIFYLLIFANTLPCTVGQDKKPLEHEDYDLWNSITGTTLSEDGNWVMYTIRDGKDNTTLKIQNLDSAKQYSIKNAAGARMSFDGAHVAYKITPDKELIKKLKKDKKPKEELPQEKFEILNLKTGHSTTMENVQSFSLPEKNGDWIAIKLKPDEAVTSAESSKSKISEEFEVTEEGLQRSKKESKPKNKKKQPASKEPEAEKSSEKEMAEADAKESKTEKKEKKSGTSLILKNLNNGTENRFPNVVSFRFDEMARGLAFVTSHKDDGDKDGVWYFDLKKLSSKNIATGLGNYKNLSFDKRGSQLAFVTDRDDYESKQSSWSLYHWRSGQSKAKKIVDESSKGLPEKWWLSSTSSPFFAENSRALFYYTAPKPEDINDDGEEDADPVAKLDLWHWQDPLLQPQQLLQAEQERNRSYLAAYNLGTRKAIQLATKDVPDVTVDPESNSDVTLGISDLKYRKTVSWDMPGFRDAYLINIRTGKMDPVLERIRNRPQLSPAGKFLIWWDTEIRQWFSKSTRRDNEAIKLTGEIQFPLFNELHDTPSDPRPYGIAGWTDRDHSVLIYDRYDIWECDPTGASEPVCITDSVGRNQEIRFRNQRLDREEKYVDSNDMFLAAFNEVNKDSGFYRLTKNSKSDSAKGEPKSPINKIIMLPERLGSLQKAQQSNRIVFTRSTFTRFPDLWATDTDFKKIKRVSKANPQQNDYSWGTVELTKWKADDGQELEGLLYKPEGFDESKKYPLMVYFYERNSDNLHRHYVPAAGRSIINFSFYVSRGYVIFVPDIPYKTGEPGPSAANAVLPGVKHVVAQGFIDEKRIGTQGHSWGGYQTAYLVTQTDMFACAESGAPVSNMTSAYGGIRWGSGLSRMFQYEKTQSRIGGTLWNAREKYIANSPLFFVDKINTPLLILHNDQDGAVPWYQGIEMFVAMRRLEKPAWLLNYNGDPHWVMGRENRLDFAKRMQQFFDHYLKDEPMPIWMAEGIPAVDKGKEFGFEESESNQEESESTEQSGG